MTSKTSTRLLLAVALVGAALMVAVETRTQVSVCTTGTIIAAKRCGDLRVLIVDASRMPFIVTMNRGKFRANRNATCEYPMASSEEGGAGARTE